MQNQSLDSFSNEELKQMVQGLNKELEYEKQSNKLLNEEYKIVKNEFYSLSDRISVLEQIKQTLGSPLSCHTKLQKIAGVIV